MTEEEMIRRVQEGRYSADDLAELYKNCLHRDCSVLLDAIHLQLWKQYPLRARKLFGPRGEKAQMLLEDVLARISEKFDLSGNKVGGHVKVGGLMRQANGYFIDLYISYKREDGEGVSLSLTQESADSNLHARVARYKDRAEDKRQEKTYDVGEWDVAVADYQTWLSELAPPR